MGTLTRNGENNSVCRLISNKRAAWTMEFPESFMMKLKLYQNKIW